MNNTIVEILTNKIIRNSERISHWNWCIGFVRGNPKRYRIRYKNCNFQLEERMNTIAGWIWVQGYICEDEK